MMIDDDYDENRSKRNEAQNSKIFLVVDSTLVSVADSLVPHRTLSEQISKSYDALKKYFKLTLCTNERFESRVYSTILF